MVQMIQVNHITTALQTIGCKNTVAFTSLIGSFSRIEKILDKCGVNDRGLWWKHTLAQCGHESVLFSKLEENLNYRAERLMEVWPRHFKTLAYAQKFAHNPEALANRIYGIDNPSIAKSLGNTQQGDGWAFHGRSWPQITGRYNYQVSGDFLEIDLISDPDKAADPEIAWLLTAWVMTRPRMLKAIGTDSVIGVTKVINGGTNGLSDRQELTNKLNVYFGSIGSVESNAPVASMPRILKLGDSGTEVRKLQQLLWDKNFPCGAIDGDFGINTHRAVKAFQAYWSMTVDGIVGPKTWKALGA